MIVDFHLHCFPDAVADRALGAMAAAAGQYPQTDFLSIHYDGTLESARRLTHEGGADYFVQMSVATTPRHQYNVNQFALQVNSLPDAFAFGSVHGAATDSLEELERLHAAGIKGIKLHHDEQGIDMDDRRLYPVYDLIAQMGLPCVIHPGFDPFSPERSHATPAQILKIHAAFPKLNLVLAHLGGFMDWEGGESLAGKGMWMDTSLVSVRLDRETAARIIRKNGVENVLLGSDMPWTTIREAIDYLDSLDLTDREKEMIAGENAARLLEIGG
jgi:hypothetical protein